MVGEHCDYERQTGAQSRAGVFCSDLVTALCHGRVGVEVTGGEWLEAGTQAVQTGLQLDTFPSIPHGLPGNGQGPLSSSSCSQRLTVARPRETKRP